MFIFFLPGRQKEVLKLKIHEHERNPRAKVFHRNGHRWPDMLSLDPLAVHILYIVMYIIE